MFQDFRASQHLFFPVDISISTSAYGECIYKLAWTVWLSLFEVAVPEVTGFLSPVLLNSKVITIACHLPNTYPSRSSITGLDLKD